MLTVAPPPPLPQQPLSVAPPPPPRTVPLEGELLSPLSGRTLTFDVECYANYFLLTLTDYDTEEVVREYEMYNDSILDPWGRDDVKTVFINNTMVSFNGIKYDMLVITAYIGGANNRALKTVGDSVIKERLMPWDFERRYSTRILDCDHIDLIELAPGVHSLKIYGARLRAKLLQELPIHFDNLIIDFQRQALKTYCINDNTVTRLLMKSVRRDIDVRIEMGAKYGIEIRSKSDAQIGEAIIVGQAEKLNGTTLRKPNIKTMQREFRYERPPFVYFETDQMKDWLTVVEDQEYKLSSKHKLVLPPKISKVFMLSDKKYKFGIGGIHSQNDHGSYYTDDEYDAFQIDVGSFYPNIILNGGFYPPQIGKGSFDTVYRELVNKRNKAKADLIELNKRDSTPEIDQQMKELNTIIAMVKIILNGSYGKLGSHYSKLFAPGMLLNVTLTGQLSLLMLIEQLVKHDMTVLSSNTDGITVRILKSKRAFVDELVKWWCDVTGFTMDYDEYHSVHYRDVNNYFCHYKDGSVKGIGIFAKESLKISPANFIIRDACFAWVKDGTDPEETINECEDIHMFVRLKKVAGGAVKDGEDIGGAVRWYRSTMTSTAINAKTSGNQVAGSACGMPIMDYPDDQLPVDLDRQWYIYETYNTLAQAGLLPDDGSIIFWRHDGTNVVGATKNKDMIVCDSQYGINREMFFETIGVTAKDIKKYNII